MSDAWAIQVNAGAVEVRKPERGNSYCVFTFVFRIGAVNHRLVKRYSKLRNFHVRLSGLVKNLPQFPPKSWLFQNTTDLKFQQKRRAALLNYFQIIVKEPYILKLELFQTLLNLPDNLRRKMVKIAEDMDSKKYILEQHLGGYSSSASSRRDSLHPENREYEGKYASAGARQLTTENAPRSGVQIVGTPQQLARRHHKKDLKGQKRLQINNILKDIHSEFKKSFPEKVQDEDELDTEIEELKEHPKVKKYEKAIKDYRIFTLEEVLPDSSELAIPRTSLT